MIHIRKVIISLLALLFILSFTACGGSGKNTDISSASNSKGSVPTLAGECTTSVSPIEVDTKLSADSVLGSWIDTSSPERFANITRTESGYQYEDNDGIYMATFADGVLTVYVEGSETANVYFDSKANLLVLMFDGKTTKFDKK